MRREKMWAITGNCGLCTGTAYTRQDAIRLHIQDLCIIPSERFPTEKAAWKWCRKKGDHAIKVIVEYKEVEK